MATSIPQRPSFLTSIPLGREVVETAQVLNDIVPQFTGTSGRLRRGNAPALPMPAEEPPGEDGADSERHAPAETARGLRGLRVDIVQDLGRLYSLQPPTTKVRSSPPLVGDHREHGGGHRDCTRS